MKKTRRIIIFRFHDHFSVCRNHIELIRFYNPGVKIYGLYGGPERSWKYAKKLPLEHVWRIPIDDPVWKWLHGDLCVRWWFREYGHKIVFDMLHVFEWDLVLLESVERYFHNVRTGVALTFVEPLLRRYDTWTWTAPDRGRWEWFELKKYVQQRFGYVSKNPLTGVFPGVALSRKFLKRYASIEVPGYCNDEVRVSLFAAAFKMSVQETGFPHEFFTANRDKVFSPHSVYSAYQKGVKSFHPVAQPLDFRMLRTRVLFSRKSV